MKKAITLCLCLLAYGAIFAQNPARITIKGIAIDSSNGALPFATVMLLTPKDSTLVNFGRADEKGAFEFKNVKNANYLLKISSMSYLPFQQEISPSEKPINDLGNLKLKLIAKELMEVVIKTARAPLSIKGDTIEYNAASFKVPPGSTVEDLLRKLPGVQIDQEGNIKAQGQDVKKVTVDGKQFFGTDPKLATKNLPAEAITKIQVFNDKTEQSKITGIDDGKKEKTMNLELKESFKKGGFGKVTVAGGTDQRGEFKANYNKFDSKQQFAFIGNLNNTNQGGISWDDYQDFKGSSSFNWGDDADFGFSGGRRFIYFGDEDEGVSISPGGGGNRNSGFATNGSTGVNYNYDTKKTKFTSSYYYNQVRTVMDSYANRKTFLQNDESFDTRDSSNRVNFSSNHRVNLRFQKEIDSLNTLIVISNSRFTDANNTYGSNQNYLKNNLLASQTAINNSGDKNSFGTVNSAIYRHKFKKKGRSFALSAGYNMNQADANARQISLNNFFNSTSVNAALRNIRQLNATNSVTNQYKASVLFVEPLSKKLFLETFYNTSLQRSTVNRDVDSIFVRNEKESYGIVNELSRNYINEIAYNRVGTSLRYNYKGFNLSGGLAWQNYNLRGEFINNKLTQTKGTVSRNFSAFAPNFSLNYDLKNNRYLYGEYSVSVQEPSVRDLQPIVDNSNPRYISEGNPDLLPQITKNISGGFNKFDPATFVSLYVNLNYDYNINQVVYNQTIDANFVTRTKPVNISGGWSFGPYFGFGFPLKKTKATMNLNGYTNFSKNITYINGVLNNTNGDNYNISMRLDLTPNDKFTFYGNASLGISNTKYSINTAQNQQVFNNNFGGEMNVKFPKEIYFNTKFNYRVYKNDRFGFNQKIPLMNMSVYKIVGKAKKAELRFTAYDIFKRNLGITQSASQNYVSQERIQTLSRYFMLSYTYNMRGVKAQMRKRNSWD
jgi:outer membrane receptor protein involved in Fe transport